MGDVYVRRLRAVAAEFNAAQLSLSYVDRNWQKQPFSQEFRHVTPSDLKYAIRNVEATYVIRLFAEFEGVLKDHLTTNHSQILLPKAPRVDLLIGRVLQQEAIRLDPLLRLKLDAVRNYRNSVAHRARGATPAIPLVAALSTLNTIVAKLPDPLI